MANNKELKTLKEAIKYIKQNSKANFDATIEAHFNLNLDVTKPDQMFRASVVMPNGTGQEVKVAAFASSEISNADLNLSEADLKKIESGKMDPKKEFDVLVAEPRFMAKIANVARILGPAGLMPSPKNGTVTDDVAAAVEQIKKGKLVLKTEQKFPMVHTVIGKESFSDEKLVENFNELYTAIKSNKPQKAKPNWIQSCFISTSMSPSAKVDLTSL